MAIKLKSTADIHTNGFKVLVYGQAGAGKTYLIKTLPNPVVLSAEGGLLSLQKADLPYIEIQSMQDLREAYEWAKSSDEAAQFESVALDSITEVAEVVLNSELSKQSLSGNKNHGAAAYGEMAKIMAEKIRLFLHGLPGKHIYMSAKLEKSQDEMGKMLYSPSMPGNKLTQSLPYFFDEVLALRVEKDNEGVTQRALMCESDGLWQAKDRSGKLGAWEAPDMGEMIKKIGGES